MPIAYTIIYVGWIAFQLVLGQRCYVSKEEFIKDCVTSYKGVVDGGRCFFIPDGASVGWQLASVSCPPDSVFAQVHTKLEMDKIFTTQATAVWIAMNNPNGGPKTPCPGTNLSSLLSLTDHFWYDGDVQNSKLPAGKTWIRTRLTDDSCGADPEYRDGECIILWIDGDIRTFADIPCADSHGVLCQFSSLIQNYTLVSGIFITEASIETIDVVDKQECVNACSQRMWCRSFNVCYNSGMQLYVCQLYTWAHADGPKTAASDVCEYYSYDP